ncbi:MAG: serine/threonine protein kinase [Polyangiaceae bacterium]|nr:serine/threonine protein kinase [Polyangiaceae bacterium]
MGEIHADVVRRAKTRVGSVLCGKYMLDALLGVGGMAAVYAATCRDGSRVAVKMLHMALSTEADLRKRFLREGYVSNMVNHPGVARVLDDDTHADDGSIFLVMDLVEGASAEIIAEWRGGRVDPDVVVGILYQLLEVIAAAHASGVIHRDIKPDNICLTRKGEVKLLDFGVARLRDAVMATREGTTIGTPAFMAPEQALGKVAEIDTLSDLYAVGAVMFRMLSGCFVHDGENSNELLIMAATRRARSLSDVVSDVPKPIIDVVDRALVYEKELRWTSALSMREALRMANIASFGRLPIEGQELADVLDGIEWEDHASTVDEDEWPTLLMDRAVVEVGPGEVAVLSIAEVEAGGYASASSARTPSTIRESDRQRDKQIGQAGGHPGGQQSGQRVGQHAHHPNDDLGFGARAGQIVGNGASSVAGQVGSRSVGKSAGGSSEVLVGMPTGGGGAATTADMTTVISENFRGGVLGGIKKYWLVGLVAVVTAVVTLAIVQAFGPPVHVERARPVFGGVGEVFNRVPSMAGPDGNVVGDQHGYSSPASEPNPSPSASVAGGASGAGGDGGDKSGGTVGTVGSAHVDVYSLPSAPGSGRPSGDATR